MHNRPTIAVVTGSGGIKTFGAVALYEFLDEAGIVPDLLIGCSGGALMTALRAAGYTPAQMLEMIPEFIRPELYSKVDYRALLGIPGLPFGRFDLSTAILKPDFFKAAHRRLFGDRRLEDLDPPVLIQVTDFQTGEGFVLDRGLLTDAVYASGALYPALPLHYLEGRWLVDGAFSSPCPVIEAVKRNIDLIIAITIETRLDAEPATFLDLFNYSQSMCTNLLMKNQMATAINLHHYEIVQINLRFERPVEFWQLDAIPLVLETGRKAVAEKKEQILSAIENYRESEYA
ncbi:MAG: patatin-like phospholipase family protein [Acidobacteriota bacterium]|nr:MAG: patatin-like phospholipase family protein [Acidobacteriota bacterium]